MRRATQHAENRAARLVTQTVHPDTREAIVLAGLEAVTEAIACCHSGGQLTPGIDAAWLTLVLRDLRVRDDAWSKMGVRQRRARKCLA
jgi:hypothetical protein